MLILRFISDLHLSLLRSDVSLRAIAWKLTQFWPLLFGQFSFLVPLDDWEFPERIDT